MRTKREYEYTVQPHGPANGWSWGYTIYLEGTLVGRGHGFLFKRTAKSGARAHIAKLAKGKGPKRYRVKA